MQGAIRTKKIRSGKRISRKASSNLFVLSVVWYPLVLFLIFWVGVNFNSILLAFQSVNVDGSRQFVGFDNFVAFCKNAFSMQGSGTQLMYSFRNSLIKYAVSVVVCMPLYLIFSYQIYKKCFLHETIRAISMVPSIISGYVISLLFVNFIQVGGPLYYVMSKTGHEWFSLLYPTINGKSPWIALATSIIYTIWLSFSTNLLVYPNAMNSISPDIRDAAKIDGVNNGFTDLRYIVLPLIFPTIETFLITGLSGIFMDVGPLIEFYYLSAPDYASYVGYYYQVQVLTGNVSQYGLLAAGGLILTAITAPLVFLLKWCCDKFGPSTDAGGDK